MKSRQKKKKKKGDRERESRIYLTGYATCQARWVRKKGFWKLGTGKPGRLRQAKANLSYQNKNRKKIFLPFFSVLVIASSILLVTVVASWTVCSFAGRFVFVVFVRVANQRREV